MKIRSAISCAVVLYAGLSYGDDKTARPSLPSTPVPEHITGSEATSATTDVAPPRDPFGAYEPGPKGTRVWNYSQLTPQEKAQLDKGRTAGLTPQTAAAYATAVRGLAQRGLATAAAQLLGIDNLAMIGLVK